MSGNSTPAGSPAEDARPQPVNVDLIELGPVSRIADDTLHNLREYNKHVASLSSGSEQGSLFGDVFQSLGRLNICLKKLGLRSGSLRSSAQDDRLSALSGIVRSVQRLYRIIDANISIEGGNPTLDFTDKTKPVRFPFDEVKTLAVSAGKLRGIVERTKGTTERRIDVEKSADSDEKDSRRMPDNPDVRDLCHVLEKAHKKISSGTKTEIQIAREFAGNERKARSLLRQARRYRHLWKRADK